MIHKKPRSPATQRSFGNSWGELAYLCKKIHYWLYARKQRTGAERYLNRLERILRDLPENDIAIVREEALALFYELKEKIDESIAHRRREIELMERLHREARSPKYADSTRTYMLRDRDVTVLKERREILEALKEAKARQPTI